MPLVSVIIPAYNPGPYLQLAVESVVQQNFQDWELIVVDDGSPQDITSIEQLDPRVRLVRQKNGGQSLARNTGIAVSKGEYLSFLDQDDLWCATKLDRQLEALEKDKQAVLCHTQFDFIDQEGNGVGEGFGRHQTYQDLLQGSGICGASTVMVRRAALEKCGGFDFFSQPAEDYDLWLRLMYQNQMSFVPSNEARYRKHSFNQSIQYQQTYRCICQIIGKHLLMAQSKGDAKSADAARKGLRRIKGTFASQAYDQSRENLRQSNYQEFLNHFLFASQHSPKYVLKSLASKALKSSHRTS